MLTDKEHKRFINSHTFHYKYGKYGCFDIVMYLSRMTARNKEEEKLKPITRDLFYKYYFLSSLQTNPSGSRAAFIAAKVDEKTNDYSRNLWCYDGDNIFKLTSSGKDTLFLWKDDDTILFVSMRDKEDEKKSGEGYVISPFYEISVHGGEAQKVFTLPLQIGDIRHLDAGKYLICAETDLNAPDYYRQTPEAQTEYVKQKKEDSDYETVDEYPYFLNGEGFTNKKRSSLYLYDISTKEITRITSPTMQVDFYAVSPDGMEVAYSGADYTEVKTQWQQIYTYDVKKKETDCRYALSDAVVYCVMYEKEKLLALASFGKEYGTYEYGKIYQVYEGKLELYIDNDSSMENTVGTDCRLGGGKGYLNIGGYPYLLNTVRGNSVLVRIKDGRIEPIVEEAGTVDDFTCAGDRLYLIGMFENRLQELYCGKMPVSEAGRFPKEKIRLRRISSINAWVQEEYAVAEPEELLVPRRGSGNAAPADIQGWVLLPKNHDKEKSYPAILNIHGGPKCAFGPVFCHEMQYWAGLGYFVFFCNPRGSDGYGNAYADIRHRMGTIDYEDLMRFTDEVLKRYPQIDRSRLAVTGGSYGGYMTNWIVGHTDRFACGAAQRSISNWLSEMGASDCGLDVPYEHGFAGDEVFDIQDELWECSPLRFANQVKTPLLFIHSFEDYRCPISEAYQFYMALKCRGVDTRMCLFKGENHELSRSGRPLHRSRRLREITEWIQRYCVKTGRKTF